VLRKPNSEVRTVQQQELAPVPPRTHQFNKAKEHQEKAEQCYWMAERAISEFEKQSWLELGNDWMKLCKERSELAERTPSC
jgi:hypothetical protein